MSPPDRFAEFEAHGATLADVEADAEAKLRAFLDVPDGDPLPDGWTYQIQATPLVVSGAGTVGIWAGSVYARRG